MVNKYWILNTEKVFSLEQKTHTWYSSCQNQALTVIWYEYVTILLTLVLNVASDKKWIASIWKTQIRTLERWKASE